MNGCHIRKKAEGMKEDTPSDRANGNMETRLWTVCFRFAEKSVKSNSPPSYDVLKTGR